MLLENISTLLAMEDFWIILSVVLGSLVMTGFAFLYAIREADQIGLSNMDWIQRIAFFLSILAAFIFAAVFVFSFIVLFALAGAVSTAGMPL